MTALLTLIFCTPVSLADDGIDSLMDSIPDIEDPVDEEEAKKPKKLASAEMDLPTYTRELQRIAVQAWSPKAKIVEKNPKLASQVLVKLDFDGKITSIREVQLSGNKKFDQSVVEALNSIDAFPQPAPGLISAVEAGIILEFDAAAKL